MRMSTSLHQPISAGASRRRSAAFVDQSVALAALPRGHSSIRIKRANATRLALPSIITFLPTIPPSPNFGVEPSFGCPGWDRTSDQVINSHLLCH